jgi:hypothetical protein
MNAGVLFAQAGSGVGGLVPVEQREMHKQGVCIETDSRPEGMKKKPPTMWGRSPTNSSGTRSEGMGGGEE